MTAMVYQDFDLSIEASSSDPTRYRARASSEAAGQANGEFTLPFSDQELEILFLRLGRPRRGVRAIGSPEMKAAQAFGSQLFSTVFSGQLQSALLNSLHSARQQNQGLRIRLRLSEAPALADLPWEFLYDGTHDHFLAYSTVTPLVRYLNLLQTVAPLAVQPPLKVLVMIANPHDHGYATLDVEDEWRKVQGALAGLETQGLVQVKRLEAATLSALQRQLRRDQYHIFHFVGHGGFDQQSQGGVLLLEDEQGRSRMVSGHYLGALLRDHFSLRLALLNACEGARTSRANPFAGVAQHLVQQGIPAVIAMQFEITDQAAITLSHEFYNALADNYGVDAALAEARKALYAAGNDIEWGTPVLYIRTQDGYLFDAAALAQVKATRTLEATSVQPITQSEPSLLVQDAKPPKEQLTPVTEPAKPAVTAKPEAETALPQARKPATVQSEVSSTPIETKSQMPVVHDEAAIAEKDKHTLQDGVYKLSSGSAPTMKKRNWWKIAVDVAATLGNWWKIAVGVVAILRKWWKIVVSVVAILTVWYLSAIGIASYENYQYQIHATATQQALGATATALAPQIRATATALAPHAQATVTAMISQDATALSKLTEAFGIEFVPVPGGAFMMGNPDGIGDYNEHPYHEVKVDNFWIGKTEVTNAQYRHFVKAGGYKQEQWWTLAGWQWLQANPQITKPADWDDEQYKDWNGDDQPVTGVCWYEAVAYTNWLSEQTGLQVRLPTEAEWERAARGDDGRTYPWGDEEPTDQLLNYYGNINRTSSVGSYPKGASPYGALDMAGNVREWTSSRFDSYPYHKDDGREYLENSDARIERGGSWRTNPNNVRAAYRVAPYPYSRYNNLGFRLVVAMAPR